MESITDADYGTVTPLITEFYDDVDVFSDWFSSALETLDDSHVMSIMKCIKVFSSIAERQAARGDFFEAHKAQEWVDRYTLDLGRMIFKKSHEFVSKASEECK